MKLTGDVLDKSGNPRSEELELWRRDPVECVRELIGNPALRDDMTYAPRKIFEDMEKEQRVWEEMYTADWWWDVQVCAICLF